MHGDDGDDDVVTRVPSELPSYHVPMHTALCPCVVHRLVGCHVRSASRLPNPPSRLHSHRQARRAIRRAASPSSDDIPSQDRAIRNGWSNRVTQFVQANYLPLALCSALLVGCTFPQVPNCCSQLVERYLLTVLSSPHSTSQQLATLTQNARRGTPRHVPAPHISGTQHSNAPLSNTGGHSATQFRSSRTQRGTAHTAQHRTPQHRTAAHDLARRAAWQRPSCACSTTPR
jgi:hypothetical protein